MIKNIKILSIDELISSLKLMYINSEKLQKSDLEFIRTFITEDYTLLGIIGLILNDDARILLGKKQNDDLQIQAWCNQVFTNDETLKQIAISYLTSEMDQVTEIVLRKVMLEYPKEAKPKA